MIAFWTLAIFFAFSSFAFGCMEPWSIATCEVILFLGAGFAGWKDKTFWRWPRNLSLPALLALSLIVVGCIQLVPLPVAVWRHFKAERVLIYDEGRQAEMLLRTDAYRRDPFGPDADKPLPPDNSPLLTPEAPAWIPATFTPMATARGLIAVLATGCLILLLQKVSEDARALRALALVVGCLGLLVALIALAQYTETPAAILWVRASQYAKQAFGPFVNPNHGEAFVNLTLPLLYYLIWRQSLHHRRLGNRWGLRVLILGLLGFHGVLLVVSHSRAAFLALALYPVTFLTHKAFQGSRFAMVGAGACLLVLVAAVAAAWWMGLLSDDGRMRLDANVPATQFALGNGLGSFDQRWPSVITDAPLLGQTRNTHLENEYLQLFFEGGILPAVLACLGGMGAFALAVKVLATRHAAFWLAPALMAETVHAAVDFTGHAWPLIGAYLLLWVLLRHDGSEERDSRLVRTKPAQQLAFAGAVAVLSGMAVALPATTLDADPWPSLLQQGGLRPLITAETALKELDCPKALHAYQVVALRANRSYQEDLFQQLRWRIASAGAELSSGHVDRAWPFLARYALWGKDFNKDTKEVEGFLLNGRTVESEFRYPLMSEDGRHTVWGVLVPRIPIRLYRKCFPDRDLATLPGWLYNQNAGSIPGNAHWAHVLPVSVSNGVPHYLTVCQIVPGTSSGQEWYVSLENHVRWDMRFEPDLSRRGLVMLLPDGTWNFDRLVCLSNSTPLPARAFLIHQYRSLEKGQLSNN